MDSDLLLNSVRRNNHAKIVNILNSNPQLKTLNTLHRACSEYAEQVNTETIKILIENGADVNKTHVDNKNVLHYAALGQNPDILKLIAAHINNINAADKYGNNALLLIARGDKDKNLVECAKILIDYNINVDQSNNRNQTPRFWIQRRNCKELSDLLPISEKIDEDEIIKREIRQSIFDRDINKFILFAGKSKDIDEFFDLVIGYNFAPAMEYILRNGGDILTAQPTVLSYVALLGYYEIFEMLLKDQRAIYSGNVLIQILKYMDEDPQPGVDRQVCYRLLKKYRQNIDVNYQDDRGNYVLHLASKYAASNVTKELLQMGASLANRDNFDVLCIGDMDLNTLNDHFDWCITCSSISKSDKSVVTITYDYNCLLPTKRLRGNDDVELGNSVEYVREADVVLFICRSPELRSLLLHPFISTFIYMKWHKLSYISHSNFIFYLCFCVSLIFFIIIPDSLFLLYINNLLTGILIIRELFQVFLAFKKYSTNIENYIELFLIICLIYLFFIPATNTKERNQLFAIIILLATFELVFLMGNFPMLTTNIVMLRRVSLSFFKFFCIYFVIIFGFGSSFFMLFEKTDNCCEYNDDNITNITQFQNYWITIFKTCIMLTGEFNSGDIPFHRNPLISRAIFLLFVFCIVIVLLNLVNGLAVSDIQEIRNEAELISLIARTEYISYVEDLVFNIPSPIAFFFQTYIFKRRGDFKLFLRKSISLFPNYLKENKLEVYPNQNGLIKLDNESIRKKRCKRANQFLQKSLVNSANKLIQTKRNFENERKEYFDNYRNIIKQEIEQYISPNN